MRGVFTIDPECPFLPALARGLIDELGDRLATALLLLPSRRACIALRDTFVEVTDGAPMLLPHMQPVGNSGDGELLLFGNEPLPEAIDPLRRQLLLASLVRSQRQAQGGITDEHAIRLAGDLAAFLDEMQTEEIPLDRLQDLVADEHAEHWRQILTFLGILGNAWPAILNEEGCIDPPERRRRQLDALIDAWRQNPPSRPIIAAGLTGTVPAVSRLISAIAGLEQGAIVLPGLDQDMDEASWKAVAASPAHPQHGLANLLDKLGVERSLVRRWPGQQPVCSPERRRLLAEIMRPAATSEAWKNIAAPSAESLSGLQQAEAAGFAEEAMLVSLQIREMLEEPGKTVALVTSDRTLARRVAVELARFGIDADDTAGTPLDQTPPGSFLLLAARSVIENLSPVPLLSLLKHPLASGHDERSRFRRHVRALERGILRGPRLAGGFSGYRAAIETADERYWPAPVSPRELLAWLDGVERAALPLATLASRREVPFGELIEAHLAFAEWLASDEDGASDELWAREAGVCASTFITRLKEAVRDFPPISPTAYPALLAVLMGAEASRSHATRHPRVSLLGQLESRLVSADRMLVAGLNEGVWPRRIDPSPWINRSMRSALGLPPAELQIGIAAHDLVMAASAGQCVLSRARKDHTGAPTTASRWLTRLDAVLRAGGRPGGIDAPAQWLHWAAGLDEPSGPVRPCSRPIPAPPVEARPDEAFVTEIEALIRDPYAFYARKILKLGPLDPIDADPGGSERGQIVHAALEQFVRSFPDDLPEHAEQRLLEIGRQIFSTMDHHPQVRAIWWPRFMTVADWFISEERSRRDRLQRILTERTGQLDIDHETGRFRLRARADRVEIDREGHYNIIDYKTGNAPSQKDIASGISPQLTLSALIAEKGGFGGPALPPGELLYWALRGGEDGNKVQPVKDIETLVEEAREGLKELIAYFRDPENGYPAVPRPEIAPVFSDYDHLARIDEWRGTTSGEDDIASGTSL
ncbi:MAG: double-strand break repair protein AddB [Geminicoccaceae bacterium]|nr:double-strand break repair protein AddB [Geminicoccaceae bacterium]